MAKPFETGKTYKNVRGDNVLVVATDFYPGFCG